MAVNKNKLYEVLNRLPAIAEGNAIRVQNVALLVSEAINEEYRAGQGGGGVTASGSGNKLYENGKMYREKSAIAPPAASDAPKLIQRALEQFAAWQQDIRDGARLLEDAFRKSNEEPSIGEIVTAALKATREDKSAIMVGGTKVRVEREGDI